MKNIVNILLVLVLICIFSACGRTSKPEPLEGSGYPHTYPKR